MQDCVPGRDGLDIGEKAKTHCLQVAMREHRALRSASRATGVEQPCRIGAGDGLGRVAGGAGKKPSIIFAAELDDAFQRGCLTRCRAECCSAGGVGECPPRARMLHHVGELERMELAVDRHRTQSGVPARKQCFNIFSAVARHQRRAITDAQAGAEERARQPGHTRGERTVAMAHAAPDGDRR